MASRELLPGLHGLRFLAAFSVLVFHMKGVGQLTPPFGLDYVTDRMGHGVRLFFVLSAFSLMYSTEPTVRAETWVRDFALRRFFRIAPSFYLLIALTYLLRLGVGGELADVRSLFLNVTFTFPFVADAAPSLVNGGWTVGAEMLFYGLFPLVLSLVRSWQSALIFIVGGFFAAEAAATHIPAGVVPSWVLSMGLASQLPFFAAGILAYRLWCLGERGAISAMVLSAVALIVLLTVGNWHASVLSQTVLFSALCFWQTVKPSRMFSHPIAVYWGERSYGIYLAHMPIMIALLPLYIAMQDRIGSLAAYAIGLLVTIGLTGVAAVLLYRFVERPGMQYGRRFLSGHVSPSDISSRASPTPSTGDRRPIREAHRSALRIPSRCRSHAGLRR